MKPKHQARLVLAACALCGSRAWAQQLTLEIKDYATLPITGSAENFRDNVASLLARINYLSDEPGGGKRFFVNDLNGPLYIVDKETKKVTTYLNFKGREGHGGLFHKFRFENGQANGFINFLFDPDYAHNGKFYTIHLEDPSLPGSIPTCLYRDWPGQSQRAGRATFGGQRRRAGRERTA